MHFSVIQRQEGSLHQSTAFPIQHHEVLSPCHTTYRLSPGITGCVPADCLTKSFPYKQFPRKACLEQGAIPNHEYSQYPLSPIEQ